MTKKRVTLHHAEDEDKLREKLLPPLSEFAEAYYEERRGKPQKMDVWLKKCDAVKTRVPKVK